MPGTEFYLLIKLWAGDLAQWFRRLPHKRKFRSSIPSTKKEKKKKALRPHEKPQESPGSSNP